MHRRIEEPLLAAAVKARAFKAMSVARRIRQQAVNTVGELNFTADTGLLTFEVVKDFGLEHIAADHRQARRCNSGFGLFNDAAQARSRLRSIVNAHDAVLLGFFGRYILDSDDRAATHGSARLDELTDAGCLAVDHVVGEHDGKRRIPHSRTRTKNGVTETERFGLADIDALNTGRHNPTNDFKQFGFPLGEQVALELGVRIEMVFDRALVATCDKNHFGNAGSSRFFNRVLNQRLVYHGEHFFGHGLRGRQKARAKTVDRKNNFADGLHLRFLYDFRRL